MRVTHGFHCLRHHIRTNSYRVWKEHMETVPHAKGDVFVVARVVVVYLAYESHRRHR
ncbi:MAG: hypothetical protein KGI89_02960 [Euryarchaeota archaeon]|nr:hypothetical protein [Euryarchaeota archaeon]